ncbi:MAG: hypothetical protein EOM05_09495 [Clostridia bacterium]|nr:hypothetical protein [Clostridia bacterium]
MIDFFLNNKDAIIVGVIVGFICLILPKLSKALMKAIKKCWLNFKGFYKREIKHEYTVNDLKKFLQMPPEKLSERQRIALDKFYDLNKIKSEELKPQIEEATRSLANAIDKLNIDFKNY